MAVTINIPVGTRNKSGNAPLASETILCPAGTKTKSGIAPVYTSYPPFQLLDVNGDMVGYINFEEVYPGNRTGAHKYTIESLIPDATTVRVSSVVNPDDTTGDTAVYTSDAVYLSIDDINYSKSVDVNVAAYGTGDFYIYYRPPSTAPIGNNYWSLSFELLSNDVYSHINAFSVSSVKSEDDEDVTVMLYLPYEAGAMETDFSDVNFYDGTQLLDSTIDEKSDGVYAVFLIKMPFVQANRSHLIYILSGNSSLEYVDGFAWDEGWTWRYRRQTWDDTDIAPWSNVGYLSSEVWADIAYDSRYGGTVLRLQSKHKEDLPVAEAESEALLGKWTMRYNFGVSNWNYTTFYYKPIIDGDGNYYEIVIDYLTAGTTKPILLNYNTTTLDSGLISVGTDIRLLEFTRNADGDMTVSVNGVEYLSANDTNITENTKTQLSVKSNSFLRSIQVDYIHYVDDVRTDKPIVGDLVGWESLKYAYVLMGKISYDTQTLPGLDEQLRYGVRINGVLYE